MVPSCSVVLLYEIYSHVLHSQEVEDMVDMIKRESLVRARLGLSCQSLTTELSSYLTRLICPVFRPVNIQVFIDFS